MSYCGTKKYFHDYISHHLLNSPIPHGIISYVYHTSLHLACVSVLLVLSVICKYQVRRKKDACIYSVQKGWLIHPSKHSINKLCSTRQLTVAQGIKALSTFVSTNPFPAGTQLRFVTWASGTGVSIVTESPATGYTIAAARVLITGVKTV